MAMSKEKGLEIAAAVEDLANRRATIHNDERQVLDANSAMSPVWGLVTAVTATVGATDVTNNTLTATAHGLTLGQKVQVSATVAGTMPAPIVQGTDYYLVGTVAANTFQLGLTRGGAVIDITGQGVGNLTVQPVPDWMVLDANGNIAGTKYGPNDVSNVLGSLQQDINLMTNVAPTQGNHIGNLNKMARPLG